AALGDDGRAGLDAQLAQLAHAARLALRVDPRHLRAAEHGLGHGLGVHLRGHAHATAGDRHAHEALPDGAHEAGYEGGRHHPVAVVGFDHLLALGAVGTVVVAGHGRVAQAEAARGRAQHGHAEALQPRVGPVRIDHGDLFAREGLGEDRAGLEGEVAVVVLRAEVRVRRPAGHVLVALDVPGHARGDAGRDALALL